MAKPDRHEKVIVRWRCITCGPTAKWYASRPMSYRNAVLLRSQQPHLHIIIHRCKENYFTTPAPTEGP